MDVLVLHCCSPCVHDEFHPWQIFRSSCLTFLLVNGVGHDKPNWIPIFSLCYFHHDHDGNQQQSKHQAHTMDRIVIGRSPTSNALLVYNPRNKKYYKPDSYQIDPYCLPGLVYPDIKYNGGLGKLSPWHTS
jgi:hypothetical protein